MQRIRTTLNRYSIPAAQVKDFMAEKKVKKVGGKKLKNGASGGRIYR